MHGLGHSEGAGQATRPPVVFPQTLRINRPRSWRLALHLPPRLGEPLLFGPVLRRHRARQNEERLRLGDAWRDQGLVFPGATGELLPTSTVDDQWHRALTASGLPAIRFHDLRHTHATLLLAAGVHPKIVSERLGHANISMTLDTYSHVTLQMQQSAADAFAALLKAP